LTNHFGPFPLFLGRFSGRLSRFLVFSPRIRRGLRGPFFAAGATFFLLFFWYPPLAEFFPPKVSWGPCTRPQAELFFRWPFQRAFADRPSSSFFSLTPVEESAQAAPFVEWTRVNSGRPVPSFFQPPCRSFREQSLFPPELRVRLHSPPPAWAFFPLPLFPRAEVPAPFCGVPFLSA